MRLLTSRSGVRASLGAPCPWPSMQNTCGRLCVLKLCFAKPCLAHTVCRTLPHTGAATPRSLRVNAQQPVAHDGSEHHRGRADVKQSCPSCRASAWMLSNMTPVGFEPTPFWNGALSQRLRPLGQSVLRESSGARAPVRARTHVCMYVRVRPCVR